MIGITGGIASGKSVVSERLRLLGAVVFDADLYAKEAVRPHTPGWQKVKEAFPMVIGQDLSINRPLLGKIVFADAEKRKALEEIIHPEVLTRLLSEAKQAEEEGKLVFADVPLLFEVDWESFMDEVWVVSVDENVQVKRLMQRSGLTSEEALLRIRSQWPLAEKAKRATKVIDNNGGLEETWARVDALWKELQCES